jgi:hypothetical protein
MSYPIFMQIPDTDDNFSKVSLYCSLINVLEFVNDISQGVAAVKLSDYVLFGSFLVTFD